MDVDSELNLFSKKNVAQAATRAKSERLDPASSVNYANLAKMKKITASSAKLKVHKPLKPKNVIAKKNVNNNAKKQSGSRQSHTTGFSDTCEPQIIEQAWSWNTHFVNMINYHALSHPTHGCTQVVQGYFEFAGGGAAEQACEALNAVGSMQVNVKVQSDWDKNKMTALQNQAFVKHVGEDVPCRFGDITDLVAPGCAHMLADKQVTVSLSQAELLDALRIRKCYITVTENGHEHTSDSMYECKSEESDSTTTSDESDDGDAATVPHQDTATRESSQHTSDISISESDVSVASDENDVEVLSESTLRTRIEHLFKKDGTLKAALGHAQAKWKLIAVSGQVSLFLLNSMFSVLVLCCGVFLYHFQWLRVGKADHCAAILCPGW